MPDVWTVLSPDGFPPTPDAEYATYGEAVDALAKFLKRFEAQGYYLSASRERIPLDALHTECVIKLIEVEEEMSDDELNELLRQRDGEEDPDDGDGKT